jgi:hypothetical protein
MTLFEVLVRGPVWRNVTNALEVRYKIISGVRPDIPDYLKQLSESDIRLETLIHKIVPSCIVHNPQDRPMMSTILNLLEESINPDGASTILRYLAT